MSKYKYFKYPNLLAEIKRRGETQDDIAKILKVSRVTANKKIVGKCEWSISDIELLCNHYKKDYYELFKQN